MDGNIVLSDNEQIQFGDKSGGDLKIYHDSNDVTLWMKHSWCNNHKKC